MENLVASSPARLTVRRRAEEHKVSLETMELAGNWKQKTDERIGNSLGERAFPVVCRAGGSFGVPQLPESASY